MKSRNGVFTFFVFLFLAAVILLQILSMIQSDRLFQRLNDLSNLVTEYKPDTGYAASQQDDDSKWYPGQKGDWLIWRLGGEPSTLLGMHTSSSMYTRYISSGNIFESLLKYNNDKFELEPWLAESWQVSDDGLKISFTLKDNIYFSDGKPVTTEDVEFTFNTIIDPEVDAASLANYFQDVERVEVVDTRRINFYMTQVYFKSLEFLSGMEILPKHIYKYQDAMEFNKHISNPVGSGPYKFVKWDVGQEIVLQRNENYWDKKPNINKIVYKFITNDTAAIQSLKSNNIDYMRPLPDQYVELCEDPKFNQKFHCLSYWHPGAGYFWIGWNQKREFFKDRLVRLAMTHLIDREQIIKSLLKSPQAKIPTGNFYIHGPQYDSNIEPWPYDPEKAKKLLDQSGWIDHNGDGIRDKNGTDFHFSYMIVSGLNLHTQIAKLVKDQCAKVGIIVDIEPYEGSVFFERAKARNFDAVNMAWGGGLAGDPYQIWHSSQIGNNGSNYVGFSNEKADQIMELARKTLDENKRNQMYKQFHGILHRQQPYTFIYTRPAQRFLDKRFKNVKIHKLGLDPYEWYVPVKEQKYK